MPPPQERPRKNEQLRKVRLPVDIREPFGNLLRGGEHALIALRDRGKFLASNKYYPDGLVRLLGGGILLGEKPADGASREIREEIGLVIPEEAMVPLARIDITARSEKGMLYPLTQYVFFAEVPEDQTIRPTEEISTLHRLTIEELAAVGHAFSNLDPTLVTEGNHPFFWADYGKIYGPVHTITSEELLRRHL